MGREYCRRDEATCSIGLGEMWKGGLSEASFIRSDGEREGSGGLVASGRIEVVLIRKGR
jgi:hypothetical protein